ncbi:hypothetical protein Bpfe_007567, partial [Biomphalaria pfeifferi]
MLTVSVDLYLEISDYYQADSAVGTRGLHALQNSDRRSELNSSVLQLEADDDDEMRKQKLLMF